ncbi:MAG: hypothetical protein IPH62_08800 [Ignavibacteriae bacterium]|nr:hypothetical protein [Ignavibacteriota bacterium]
MDLVLGKISQKEIVKSSVFDVLALAFVYFVPALSHLTSLPIYFIEPMRLMLILSIAHTSKKNAYIIAATLPIFSFVISAHPHLIKTFLITGELLLNVWLFFFLTEKIKNKFASMIISIGLSKMAYYAVKFGLLSLLLIDGSLISTPILIQVITTWVFSGYVFLMKK